MKMIVFHLILKHFFLEQKNKDLNQQTINNLIKFKVNLNALNQLIHHQHQQQNQVHFQNEQKDPQQAAATAFRNENILMCQMTFLNSRG